MRTLNGASGWLWVVAIIGFVGGSGNQRAAAREPSREPTVLDRISGYTSEAVLPIYVLHRTSAKSIGWIRRQRTPAGLAMLPPMAGRRRGAQLVYR